MGSLGAGLITGAADDDPSGIGRVTGHGLMDGMRQYYPRTLVYALLALIFVANVINLAADVGAMGAALKLLIGGSALLYAAGFVVLSLLLQVFIPFTRYAPILKVLVPSLFAYVATALVIDVPWRAVLRSIVLPPIRWNAAYAVGLVAVLGTTISPYLFCWQAAEEVVTAGWNRTLSHENHSTRCELVPRLPRRAVDPCGCGAVHGRYGEVYRPPGTPGGRHCMATVRSWLSRARTRTRR